MNPNSANQRWSFWEYRIYPDGTKKPDYGTVKENCARFGRMMFGTASQMRIRHALDRDKRAYWEIAIRTEGHPVHDPQYTEWIHDKWRTFFGEGFGYASEVRVHARLEAGDREDGTPPDQLIIVPSLSKERSHG